jgi:3-hydroxypropanoate dehydrogenase
MGDISEAALETLFKNARSQNGWLPEPVGVDELKAAYDIARWGPTSMNVQPMRVLFLQSEQAKKRLVPALAPSNVAKVTTAPVVALIAYDLNFHEHLPRVFPHNPNARDMFASNPAFVEATGFRNGTLQAAYFLLALRAIGLDIGPMSGFDGAKVNAEFFANSSLRINFICGIGHGDPSKVFNRLPRLEFEEIAQTL